MAHLSRWLAGEGLDAGGLTAEAAERFLAARVDRGMGDLMAAEVTAFIVAACPSMDCGD